MTSDFLLLFSLFNLVFLFFEKEKKIVEKYCLLEPVATEIFEYGKNNNEYQNKAKLYKQVVNKTLPIKEVFYLKYLFLFLFNNTISYLIDIKDTFQVQKINKNVEKKQMQLYNY